MDVFVSYSSRDKTVADALVATLERAQIRCWYAPRDIRPGTIYGEAILDGLRECRALVVIVSASSVASQQVLREVERAVHYGLTVVPFRNGIMLAVAVGWAASIGAAEVLIGSHAGDQAVYPDCRPAFTEPFCRAAEAGTYEGVRVRAPFAHLTKAEIVKRGAARRVPWEYTWSCYTGGRRPCGECGACHSRREAFAEAGVRDAGA